MDVVLPPEIAVRRLFRQQEQRKTASRDWIDGVYERDWRNGKPKRDALLRFACEYEERLPEWGAYDLDSEGEPQRLKMKTTKGYQAQAKVLWPIRLAQNLSGDAESYLEEALMIVRLGANITPLKVTAHEAPLNLCLTRHALKRMIEREALVGDAETALLSVLPSLATNCALALSRGIAKVAPEDTSHRTAFVPCLGGLAVLTNRMVTSYTHNQDLGWRVNFSKRRYSWGYLKKDLVFHDDEASHPTRPKQITISLWFVTTFISLNQLSASQQKYVKEFSVFIDDAPLGVRNSAFRIQFDPDFVYRQQRANDYGFDKFEAHVDNLYSQVQSDAFASLKRDNMAFLLDPRQNADGAKKWLSEGSPRFANSTILSE